MVHKAPELSWAQTGWIEYSATDRRTFAQVNNGGPYPINRYDPAGAQPYWQNTYYTTLYNNVPNYFSFQVNGYTWTQIRAFWVPHTGENAGEVTTKAHQFPGDSNNQQYFYDVHIWYSNAWRDFNGTQASDDWSEFYAFLENPRTLSVMDARCTYPN
jgi:hypothetical protein